MNIPRVILIVLGFALTASGLWAGEKDLSSPKSTPPQATSPKAVKQSFCPPCEMKLDPKPSLYVDVEGYRIYVCSSYCGEKIKKNPSVYIKKIQDAGETPEAAPAKQVSRQNSACGNCSMKSGCAGSGNSSEIAKK